ncbi:MAG TPA: hypothetical protein VFE17_01335 [Candidatus Baltobacteraceae bacterium]|jgi:hypothetical protein|nr:hypothetical protein [Candidatus Baltobacteraceae bacterium]
MKYWTPCAACIAAIFAISGPASADAPSAGVIAAAAIGTHEETNGRATVPLVPVPLLSVRVPFKRFEFAAEGLPPIGPVPYGSTFPGVSRGTKLSYAYAVVRYHIGAVLTAGIGETLYNQATTYSASHVFHSVTYYGNQMYATTTTTSVTEIDASRVPGLRFELQARRTCSRQTGIEGGIALTPSMHAVVHVVNRYEERTFTTAPFHTIPYKMSSQVALPETASEVDAFADVARRFGPYTVRYGLRYLNYVARFNNDQALADRNSLLLPFIGFERRLGQ